jgi:hypothetical protein
MKKMILQKIQILVIATVVTITLANCNRSQDNTGISKQNTQPQNNTNYQTNSTTTPSDTNSTNTPSQSE